MKFINRLSLFFLTILLMITFTGCWNYREIESVYIVSGMAIDKGENGNKYHFTFEYLTFTGENEGTEASIIETDGNTVFDGIRNITKLSQKKFYFADCQALIICQELAKDGIEPLLDFLTRDAEIRITIELVICKEEENAGKIFKAKSNKSEITAFSLNKMIENNALFLAKTPDISIYQAINILYGKGIELALPVVEISKIGDNKTHELQGSAIFKKDKLIGYLDDIETQYMLYTQDKVKGGLIITNDNKNNNIVLEIKNSKTKLKPVIENGKLKMMIDIKAETSFEEENSSENNANELGLEKLEEHAAKTLKNGVTNLIKKVQNEYGSDIFGFGKCTYQDKPDYWKTVEKDWGTIFPTVEVEVNAKVSIKDTAIANLRKSE